MRIRSIDPVDFLLLSATERFLWIQASIPFQQPLPTQHLVQTADASGKVVGGVEESRIAVRDFDALANQAWRQSTFQERGGMTLLEQLDCSARPNRPIPKSPPTIRRSIISPLTRKTNGVSRSITKLSSLPV